MANGDMGKGQPKPFELMELGINYGGKGQRVRFGHGCGKWCVVGHCVATYWDGKKKQRQVDGVRRLSAPSISTLVMYHMATVGSQPV